MPPPEQPTLADVVVLLAAVFDRLRIPYAFGGALATSFWIQPLIFARAPDHLP